jgi:hypothetical protein
MVTEISESIKGITQLDEVGHVYPKDIRQTLIAGEKLYCHLTGFFKIDPTGQTFTK